MLLDGRKADSGSVIEADLCVIGAGAAGITLCREFLNSSKRVVLLESGALQPDAATQQLCRGDFSGIEAMSKMDYLTSSRLRYFGGSTNHWFGYCRPLDENDFLPRPWLGAPGWPFERSALEPYYLRAAEIVDIQPFDYKPQVRGQQLGPLYTQESSEFVTDFYHFSPPTRFASKFGPELFQSQNIQVYTNSNAVAFETDTDRRELRQVQAAVLDGPTFIETG